MIFKGQRSWKFCNLLIIAFTMHNDLIQKYSGRGWCLKHLNFLCECGAPITLFQYKFSCLPKILKLFGPLWTHFVIIKPFVSAQYRGHTWRQHSWEKFWKPKSMSLFWLWTCAIFLTSIVQYYCRFINLLLHCINY